MKHRSFSLCIMLVLLLALLVVQPATAIAGVWTATGSMGTPRWYHTATLLPNGKVLVAGGDNGLELGSAELYDPATGAWAATGSLQFPRQGHTATLLPNGKVLVAGGVQNLRTTPLYLYSAELYNPATGAWTSVASMKTPRLGHTAILLANGKVLVSGGSAPGSGGGSRLLATAELYDPATNTWTPAGSMATARWFHTATLLPNGKALVVGYLVSAVAELYDPATGQWTTTGALHTKRHRHTATLLSNGMALVAGGYSDPQTFLSSAELYDSATGEWTETGSMAKARESHTATLLPNGKVLVSGGWDYYGGGYLAGAEIYDPGTGMWTGTRSLITPRAFHRAVLLKNGKVLAVGGLGASGFLASAELYTSTRLLQSKSSGPQDGWVLESSENSNQGGAINATAATFVLGDHASNRQYRSILLFNTSSLPDNAVITRVVLKIKKQSLTGINPFTTHGKILVDIRRGPFSGAGALQPTDFHVAPSKPAVGFITNKQQAGGWYAAGLNPVAYPFVNRTGITQFRLRFQLDDDNDRVADFLRFYSGNSLAANRPILVIEYYVP